MEDPENTEIIDHMNIALKKLRMWVEKREFTTKSERFEGRSPIGAVTAPIRGVNHVFVAISRDNEDYIPELEQTLLIFEEKGNEILSGIVEDYRVSKSDLEAGKALLKVRLLKSHGVSLRDIRRIKGIPTPGSPVFQALTEEILAVYGLPSPSEGISLGVICEHEDMMRIQDMPVKYILKDSFLGKHIAIGGLTGQGKTILLKNLILELADKQTNLVVIDTQGDLCQIMKPMFEDFIDVDAKIILNELGLRLEGLEDILMIRDMEFYKPFFVDLEGFLNVFPWRDFGIESRNIKTGEELALYLPELTNKAQDILEALFKLYMEKNDVFDFKDFYQWVETTKQEEKNQCYWTSADGTLEIRASGPSAQNLLRELANFLARRIFDEVPQPDIQEILNKRVVFFYLPRIKGYEELRTLLLFELISRIIGFKTQAANKGRIDDFLKRQSVVLIDEAHELIPNPHGTTGRENSFSKHVDEEFRIVATEGRKYMVSIISASQSLRKLNPNVVEQSNTLILFRGSKADIDTLSVPANIKKDLLGLKVGHAIVYCPGNLPTKNSSEIHIYPPRFLHVNPLKATMLFLEGKIKKYKF
ncbi:MAG: ATP-binding protein [Candidatus Helarchaeota archaeon]